MTIPDQRLVAIHQPNFFPWLGYFDKIVRADCFIIMDNVQYNKKGGSWSNRVKMFVNGDAAWVTMPIVRAYHGYRRYREMEINNSVQWRHKFVQTLRANYGRAPYFNEVFPYIEHLVEYQTDSLTDFNVNIIQTMATDIFGVAPDKFILGTDIDCQGASTELLVSMVQAVNGTAYMCGQQAVDYQDEDQFSDAGITLVHQCFQHPVYNQAKSAEFVPGLSIIDPLMNCGLRTTGQLLIG